MNPLIAALIGGLIQAAGSLVGRVMIALGIGLVSFSGFSSVLAAVKAKAFVFLGNAAAVASISGYVGLFQVGTCINIIASAYVIRFTLMGLQGDTLKKWVTK